MAAPRGKPEPIGQPSQKPPEPGFAELWDAVEPGSRTSKGIYSIYKTREGALHIAYRPDGTDTDQHLELPGTMIQMYAAAAEGRLSPVEIVKAITRARKTLGT